MSESPCAPPVSASSSFRTVVVRAVKLSVARANCGPSRRSAGRASSAPSSGADGRGRDAAPAAMPSAERVTTMPGGVGAEAEEGGLGQVHLPQVADGDVEADEQDAVDGQQREQAEGVGVRAPPAGWRPAAAKSSELGAADEEEALQHGRPPRPSG